MQVGGRNLLFVSSSDSPERQRFTVLHELAHIVLDLPSNQCATDVDFGMFSYAARPPEEVVCDTSAAERPLPHEFLRADLKDTIIGFDLVSQQPLYAPGY